MRSETVVGLRRSLVGVVTAERRCPSSETSARAQDVVEMTLTIHVPSQSRDLQRCTVHKLSESCYKQYLTEFLNLIHMHKKDINIMTSSSMF